MNLFTSFYVDGHLSRGRSCLKVYGEDINRYLKPHETVTVKCRDFNARGVGKIRRVLTVITRREVNLPTIMEAVKKAVENKAGLLIAGQLTFKNGKTESWISNWAQQFLKVFRKRQEIKNQLVYLKNDGAKPQTLRFFENLEKLFYADILIDFGICDEATAELLKDEISNFKRGFDIEYGF